MEQIDYVLRAKRAANARWSRPGAREHQSVKARDALLDRLRREIDPSGTLPPNDVEALLPNAIRSYSAKMNSAKRKKKADGMAVPPAEDESGTGNQSARDSKPRRGVA